MFPLGTQRLPPIEDSAAFRHGELPPKDGVSATQNTSKAYENPYTNRFVLARIYDPSRCNQTTRNDSPAGRRGDNLPSVGTASGRRQSQEMNEKSRSFPRMHTPFSVSFHSPNAYFVDAKAFTEAAEESQRMAIKFEEHRLRKQMQREFRSQPRRGAAATRRSGSLGKHGGSQQSGKLSKTPADILAAFDAALLPKKQIRNGAKLTSLPSEDSNRSGNQVGKTGEGSTTINMSEAHARTPTGDNIAGTLPSFGFHVRLPHLHSEEVHLPCATPSSGRTSHRGTSKDRSRENNRRQVHDGTNMTDTTPRSCTDERTIQSECSQRTPTAMPLDDKELLTVDPSACEGQDARTTQKTPLLSEPSQSNHEGASNEQMLRAAREKEAARMVDDALRDVNEEHAHKSASLSPQDSVNAANSGNDLHPKNDAHRSPQSGSDEGEERTARHPLVLMKAGPHVYFLEPEENSPKEKKGAGIQGASKKSADDSLPVYLLRSEEESPSQPRDTRKSPG